MLPRHRGTLVSLQNFEKSGNIPKTSQERLPAQSTIPIIIVIIFNNAIPRIQHNTQSHIIIIPIVLFCMENHHGSSCYHIDAFLFVTPIGPQNKTNTVNRSSSTE